MKSLIIKNITDKAEWYKLIKSLPVPEYMART